MRRTFIRDRCPVRTGERSVRLHVLSHGTLVVVSCSRPESRPSGGQNYLLHTEHKVCQNVSQELPKLGVSECRHNTSNNVKREEKEQSEH